MIEAPCAGWTSPRSLPPSPSAPRHARRASSPGSSAPTRCSTCASSRNPRFSAGSPTITIAFFGLFGFIFMMTMYFQAVRGYTRSRPAAHAALRGRHRHRLAGGAAARQGGRDEGGRGRGHDCRWASVVRRQHHGLGTVRTGASSSSSYVVDGGGHGVGHGARDRSILGALPPARAGVGSAVNDTTRELGGTLGVAVRRLRLLVRLRPPPGRRAVAACPSRAPALAGGQGAPSAPPSPSPTRPGREGRATVVGAARSACTDGYADGLGRRVGGRRARRRSWPSCALPAQARVAVQAPAPVAAGQPEPELPRSTDRPPRSASSRGWSRCCSRAPTRARRRGRYGQVPSASAQEGDLEEQEVLGDDLLGRHVADAGQR